ncbi:MAG TPA: peptidylprolyl isomerase [Bacteroidia bacterium]|nr:peptidylprolyl isomerase [Bacteroidia bacterium]
MKQRLILPAIALICLPFITSYKSADMRSKVLIHTDLGDIKIVLYDETPKHRDNFLKLVKDHTLDSTLFHRVIQQFMIQGGDIDSKHAKPGAMLGNGDVGYTIPAEIHPNLYHKRGALAGARQGDDVNPLRASSGCQFYIVQGKTFNDSLMTIMQNNLDHQTKQSIFTTLINKPENAWLKTGFVNGQIRAQQTGNLDSLTKYNNILSPMIDAEFAKAPHRTFTDEQRRVYATQGGAPHLDGAYTVFGEVVEGMDVVDKIAAVQVDGMARPLTDIHCYFSIVQ